MSSQSHTAIACKLATAMTLLVHSMFGCGLVHGCCVDHNLLHQCPVASNTSCNHHETDACHEAPGASTPTAAEASHDRAVARNAVARNHETCGHSDHQSGVRSTKPSKVEVHAASPQRSGPDQTCCSSPAPCSQETPACCSILHCSFMEANAKTSGIEFRRLFLNEYFAPRTLPDRKPQSMDKPNQKTRHSYVDGTSLCTLQCSWQI